mgnify:CR=1 FL=1
MKYEVLEERPVDKQTGVVSDSTIRLTGQKTSQSVSRHTPHGYL